MEARSEAADGRPLSRESRRLLALARVVAPTLVEEGVLGIAVSGSVARGDASDGSDLDLMLFAPGGDGSERKVDMDGRTVAIVRCAPDYPYSLLRNGDNFLWGYRELARLRAAIPVYDPSGFLAAAQDRASRTPLPAAFRQACFEAACRQAEWGARHAHSDPALATAALRAALMVGLTPALHDPGLPAYLYYSKPKYETRLIDALPNAEHRLLYNRIHDREAIDPAVVRRQIEAVEELAARLMSKRRRVGEEAVARAIESRVLEFISDAHNRLAARAPDEAAAPLNYAAFELAWLAAWREEADYRWVLDAVPMLRRAGLLGPFLSANRLDDHPDAGEILARAAALEAMFGGRAETLRRSA